MSHLQGAVIAQEMQGLHELLPQESQAGDIDDDEIVQACCTAGWALGHQVML